MTIKVIIIDDEKPARNELRYLLKKYSHIEIIDECADAEEAIHSVNELRPDLIFLDINMPGKTGFELLEALDHAPFVIFVTAYDNYAIQAFDANAFDYLLKPVLPERLEKSLGEMVKEIEKERAYRNQQRSLGADSRIFIKEGDKCLWVTLKDIYLAESVGNYAKLYFGNSHALLHRTVNYLEEKLPADIFFRANRSQIININHIISIHTYFKGGMLMELSNKMKIEVSQRQSVKFRERMGI